MAGKVYNEPSRVEAEEGEVHIEGPDGVAVAMTPEAALETSDRLFTGGVKAHGQRVSREARKAAPIGKSPPAQDG